MNRPAADRINEVATPDGSRQLSQSVPWQIWIVVVLLGLEGVGNLFWIPQHPAALIWLLGKCLFIVGLLKRWVWVYGLFLAFCVIHVVYFLAIQPHPMVALMNLLLIVLAASARPFYVSRD